MFKISPRSAQVSETERKMAIKVMVKVEVMALRDAAASGGTLGGVSPGWPPEVVGTTTGGSPLVVVWPGTDSEVVSVTSPGRVSEGSSVGEGLLVTELSLVNVGLVGSTGTVSVETSDVSVLSGGRVDSEEDSEEGAVDDSVDDSVDGSVEDSVDESVMGIGSLVIEVVDGSSVKVEVAITVVVVVDSSVSSLVVVSSDTVLVSEGSTDEVVVSDSSDVVSPAVVVVGNGSNVSVPLLTPPWLFVDTVNVPVSLGSGDGGEVVEGVASSPSQ